MFHFGLFSTFVPYLVVAAIYFCGLATYSVDIVNSHISDNNCKTEYSEGHSSLLHSDYQDINDNNKYFGQKINITDKEYIYTTFRNTFFWLLYQQHINNHNYSLSLCSRPPPYLS